jgi:hypothetical protein
VKPATLVLAAIAATMLVGYLVARPPLSAAVRLWLLAAIGVVPIATALTANVEGFTHTTHRAFCASCHVMEPYTRDAADPSSTSLAALHSRNEAFGEESCYVCHRDYGLFGSVTTKLGGLRHTWAYYVRGWREPLKLYHPYPNHHCVYCHSTRLPGFMEEPEHAVVKAELDREETSCVADGCHGPSHPRASR